MALTYNYAHLWETMRKGLDDQGPYYNVDYRFDNWADSDDVANQLMGYTQRVGTTTIRVPPHQHPLSPNLYCTDVQIEGLGQPILNTNGYPDFDSGFIAHATYRSSPWILQGEVDPGNNNQIDPSNPILWATQELDFDTEEYVHEKNQYKWLAPGEGVDGKLSGIPVKVTVGITTMTITFQKLPYLPMTHVRNLRNKVNDATFLGAAKGKVLFKGGRTVREQNTDGTISQMVALTFQERTQEWNKFLRRDKLKWTYLWDGTDFPFEEADLTPLINL